MELLSQTAAINTSKLSRNELFILEAEFFTYLCDELKQLFGDQYKDYFRLIKSNSEKESEMIEEKLTNRVINDILSSGEYTLPGIAYYTHTPEDVVFELATGQNTNPSAALFRKIIKLHRSVRPELYKAITQKIVTEHFQAT